MAYNEDSSFKLKSALKDGSNPPFKAMGATDAPTKFGFDKKRKTEVKKFPNQKVDPLNIVGGIKQVISDVNTAAGNITSKTQAFGDKIVSDAGDAIGQITQPIERGVKNLSENISNIAKTDVPRQFVTDVKNLFTNLSAKNKALNEKKRQKDANKPKKEKKKGNIFGN